MKDKEPFEKEAQGVKQVVVVRKDLNMRKGKIAAQVAHASMGVLLSQMNHQIRNPGLTELADINPGTIHKWFLSLPEGCPLELWLNGPFAKIVVYVENEEALLAIQEKATKLSVMNYLIIDSGKTEFNGVPTKTCIAVGPDFNSKIDEITGGLPLL